MSMDYRKYMDEKIRGGSCDGCCEKCGRGTKEAQEAANGITENDILELCDALIAALANYFLGEHISQKSETLRDLHRKFGDDTRIVILADPKKGYRLCAEDAFLEELTEDGDFDPHCFDTVLDEELLINYDEADVAVLGDERYLIGPMVIFEIDEYGNECSITEDTIRSFFEYAETGRTLIEVDGKNFPAFRLD